MLYIHSTQCAYRMLLLKCKCECVNLCAVCDRFNAAQCGVVNETLEI